MQTKEIFIITVTALSVVALVGSTKYACETFTTRDEVDAKVKKALAQLYQGLEASNAKDAPTLEALKFAIQGVDLTVDPPTFDDKHPPQAIVIRPGDLRFGLPQVRDDRAVVIPILQ
jgi:hypothetical protein